VLIESLVETPQAVWFTKGTPDEAFRSVEATVRRARGTADAAPDREGEKRARRPRPAGRFLVRSDQAERSSSRSA
jgi:hypothetical protein